MHHRYCSGYFATGMYSGFWEVGAEIVKQGHAPKLYHCVIHLYYCAYCRRMTKELFEPPEPLGNYVHAVMSYAFIFKIFGELLFNHMQNNIKN